jgi:DNA end-binding protein Ku
MPLRSIASLSLTFGLVSIPVKLYSATEQAAALRFKWMSRGGARLLQRYVAQALPVNEPIVRHAAAPLADPLPDAPDAPPNTAVAAPVVAPTPMPTSSQRAATLERRSARPVPSRDQLALDPPAPEATPPEHDVGDEVTRDEMVKGYEYEKGKFVLFTPAELDALRAQSRESIDIVAFIPDTAVDPIYYDKAYLLAPDQRGHRPYALLLRALAHSQRSALAQWVWKGKQHVVQIRAATGGLVLQQLFYADEVRLPEVLGIEPIEVSDAELQLALQLIAQGARDAYDPHEFVDEEKQRILDVVRQKVAGRKTVTHAPPVPPPSAPSAEVIDLLQALKASLGRDRIARKPVARAKQRAHIPARASDAAAADSARARVAATRKTKTAR